MITFRAGCKICWECELVNTMMHLMSSINYTLLEGDRSGDTTWSLPRLLIFPSPSASASCPWRDIEKGVPSFLPATAMFFSLSLVIYLLIIPRQSLLSRHYARRGWVHLLAVKRLLEDRVKTKVYWLTYKKVCLSKIIYLVQGHTENLLQCVVGKITLALQMWLGNMSQILVMSVFNNLGLVWVHYSK